MLVNICMVTYNRLELTRRAIGSLLERTRLPGGEFVLHVTDNASSDGTAAYLREVAARHSNVRLFLLSRNMGVAVGANLGWGAVDADYYLKYDNDIVVLESDWLQKLVAVAARNLEVGQVGYLYGAWPYPLENVRLAGGDLFTACGMCNGGCVLIPRRTHERLGFWNEDYGRYGFEDLDYSARADMAGFLTGYAEGRGDTEHLGYAPATRDEALEALKARSVASGGRAEKLFVLNRFLFRQGLREFYVKRKYLPLIEGEKVAFRSNPEYLPLIKMQEELLELISYEYTDSGVALDLTALARLRERLRDSH